MSKPANTLRTRAWIRLGIVLSIILLVNMLGSIWFGHIDLTEEKRFTLTPATLKILRETPDVISVKVLLEGNFPAGFRRLQNATREMLQRFKSENANFQYVFEDPNVGSVDEINGRRQSLSEQGIMPVNFRYKDNDQTTEKLIYPVAIFNYGQKTMLVNLLENETPGLAPEEALNNSVSLLEYKFINAIQKLTLKDKQIIAFTTGKGEPDIPQLKTLKKQLQSFYTVAKVNLDSVYKVDSIVNLLIVAGPTKPFTERNKFVIDQYLMHGGRIIFLINKLNVSLDSMMGRAGKYSPYENQLGLDDLLFKYGCRIQPNMVLDLECSKIPLVTGQTGSAKQIDMFPWYYHSLSSPGSSNAIVKNIDRVNLFEPSSIDTVRTKTPVEKTILLSSSKYSRTQFTPVELNFDILRYDPDPAKFNEGPKAEAVLLEGVFPSLYENRVSEDQQAALSQMKSSFRASSKPSKIIVVSDADFVQNLSNASSGEAGPIGYNRFEKQLYKGSNDFISNSIEYMLDEGGVLQARTREVKLRMLNKVKADDEKTYWQLVNVALPVILLLIFGLIFQYRRKRKYTRA
ncbi:MAG: gliding motility-associated ABC transporter substrate-binding protein GldG [Saprospiraceae bacterium]